MSEKNHIGWTVWAIILFAPVIAAILIWQLFGLTPSHWCGVQIGSAKAAGLRPEDCSSILSAILAIKDHTIIGLLLVLGLSCPTSPSL